jgi:hypothetical protein
MTSPLTRLAVMSVRAWTRVLTWRLPRHLGETRRAEIESDLWESQNQPAGATSTGAEILLRLLLGIPSDLVWRAEDVIGDNKIMYGKTALAAAAGVVMVAILWMFTISARPQFPPLPERPTPIYVEKRRTPPPPPPPPPSWREFAAKVTGREPKDVSKPKTPR